MTRRYIRDKWYATTPAGLNKGDYVLATKYRDGDPADHFCIGYHDRTFDHFGHDFHLVVDADGESIQIQRLSPDRVDQFSAWVMDGSALRAHRAYAISV